jgi:hypothetical protein
MRGTRLVATWAVLIAMAALIMLSAGSSSREALAGTFVDPRGAIDIELAFDTTASMAPSIERAQRDGASIVAGVRDAFPDARFAVVSFRDYGNPSGDYEVHQPMTGDIGAVEAAFLKLRPVSNPSPLNTPAEEYNLLFHESYTDRTIDWRPDARKVVVVVGDGQPHGAGTSGITGCSDTSVDYYGLNTATVLAGMQAAERTLVMIRQISPETTVSLDCYLAMAERSYVGGAARDGGDVDLARPIVGLVQSAVAPVTVRPDVDVALPGGTSGYTVTVANPNSFALGARSVSVALPAGFRYRSGSATRAMSSDAAAPTKVSWQIERVLRPSEKISLHFRASAPRRPGRYATEAVVRLDLPSGSAIASTSRASLRVSRRLRGLSVAVRAERPLKRSVTASLRAGVRIALRPSQRRLSVGRVFGGRLALGIGRRGRVSFRIRSYRIISFGSPTALRLDLTVERVRGMPACSPRARGSAWIVDDQRFGAGGLRRDIVVTAFGANCAIATGRWSNGGSNLARAQVAVAAK